MLLGFSHISQSFCWVFLSGSHSRNIFGGPCPIVGEGSALQLLNRAHVWSGSSKPPPHPLKQRFHQMTHILITGLYTSQSSMRGVFSDRDVWAKPWIKFSGARGCSSRPWIRKALFPWALSLNPTSSLSASVVVLMGFKRIFTKPSSDQWQTLKWPWFLILAVS